LLQPRKLSQQFCIYLFPNQITPQQDSWITKIRIAFLKDLDAAAAAAAVSET
jgi:hypothetical protein